MASNTDNTPQQTHTDMPEKAAVMVPPPKTRGHVIAFFFKLYSQKGKLSRKEFSLCALFVLIVAKILAALILLPADFINLLHTDVSAALEFFYIPEPFIDIIMYIVNILYTYNMATVYLFTVYFLLFIYPFIVICKKRILSINLINKEIIILSVIFCVLTLEYIGYKYADYDYASLFELLLCAFLIAKK